MMSNKNPYRPDAGKRPNELAGRNKEMENFEDLVLSLKDNEADNNIILIGLRGVGKTVLLNEFEKHADSQLVHTVYKEWSSETTLGDFAFQTAKSVGMAFSRLEKTKEIAFNVLAIVKSFAKFHVKTAELDLSWEPDIEALRGIADSGLLEKDLTELFLYLGELAQKAQKPIVFLIDELQLMKKQDYEALIMALHRLGQKDFPIALVGAGLPLLPSLSGEAKSYSERLFLFQPIGALSQEEAYQALSNPASKHGVSYSNEALAEVMKLTHGYPYFIQLYGKHLWKHKANKNTIEINDVRLVNPMVIAELDRSFFATRIDKIEGRQLEYIQKLAELGDGPQSTTTIAQRMGYEKVAQASSTRTYLINKAVIFSPNEGKVDFTTPLCADYIRRKYNLQIMPE